MSEIAGLGIGSSCTCDKSDLFFAGPRASHAKLLKCPMSSTDPLIPSTDSLFTKLVMERKSTLDLETMTTYT